LRQRALVAQLAQIGADDVARTTHVCAGFGT
jgi:hypothetical protein